MDGDTHATRAGLWVRCESDAMKPTWKEKRSPKQVRILPDPLRHRIEPPGVGTELPPPTTTNPMASIAPPAHNRGNHTTDTWITPKHLIDQFGPFDLDPCQAPVQPWPCADRGITEQQDGLSIDWEGFVWCNPPYGRQTGTWMERMAAHGNGIALIFARTETAMFFEHIWRKADALLFLAGRLSFCREDGTPAKHNSGGPSVLVGYGSVAVDRLRAGAHLGRFVTLDHEAASQKG